MSKIIKTGYFRRGIKLRQRFALSSVTELLLISLYTRGKLVFSKTLRTWWSLLPSFFYLFFYVEFMAVLSSKP